jgi:hypothetical protein
VITVVEGDLQSSSRCSIKFAANDITIRGRAHFVESAVNQVIAKRFVKKQQMRWTPRGAHLLLQIRTQVLNDELRASFEKWYPCFGVQVQEPLAA